MLKNIGKLISVMNLEELLPALRVGAHGEYSLRNVCDGSFYSS